MAEMMVELKVERKAVLKGKQRVGLRAVMMVDLLVDSRVGRMALMKVDWSDLKRVENLVVTKALRLVVMSGYLKEMKWAEMRVVG